MTELLTQLENKSIRLFVQHAADEGYLSGRVLDYGCGKQPYRDIVKKAGGTYTGYDREGFPANQAGDVGEVREVGAFDWQAILCTQVIQYVHHVPVFLRGFKTDLSQEHGHLVLTYPTNWPEVQDVDLHRFTKAGMERLLTEAGFTILEHEPRAWVYPTVGVIVRTSETKGIEDAGTAFALGYGVIARA